MVLRYSGWCGHDQAGFFLYLDLDIPPNALLVTFDVLSLYTNIPTTEGIDACIKLLDERTEKSVPTESLCDLRCHYDQIFTS